MRLRVTLFVLCALASGLAGAGAARAAEPVFVVTGRGWGHGVGLSQWGARGYAERGRRYRGILAHYYPGTTLGAARTMRVRVLLVTGRPAVRIGSKRGFVATDARGRRVRLPAGGIVLGQRLVVRIRGKAVRLHTPVRFEPGARPLRLDTRPYRGALVVRAKGHRFAVVNDVPLELYIRGVVPYEMPHDWPLEALKSQAVVARSYALATMRTGGEYDLLPDTRDQVYGGLVAEKPESTRAVKATAGQVLLWRGRVATTYYHSTSGGRTAAVHDAWPKVAPVPYLRSVFSPFEAASPKAVWGPYVVPARRLAARLGTRVPSDAVVERNGSGRVVTVSVGGRRVGARAFQDAFGLGSGWFTIGVLRLDPAPASTYGGPLVLRGIAREVAGAIVERRDHGRWRQVARVRPRLSGAFRVRVRALGSEYRIAGRGAAGPPVRVPLAPALRVQTAGGALTGVVRPALPAVRVRIQRRDGTRWTTVASTRIDARGSFRAGAILEPGEYRAWVPATRGFLAAASAPLAR